MKALRSSADILGNYMLKCPACDKIAEFTVVFSQLAVLTDKLPVKKHGIAVCESCKTVFNVKDEVIWTLAYRKGGITPFDLTEIGGEK